MKKFKTKAYRITNRTNEVCDRKGSIKKGKKVRLCGSFMHNGLHSTLNTEC